MPRQMFYIKALNITTEIEEVDGVREPLEEAISESADEDPSVVTLDEEQTLSNKRITRRVVALTDAATVTLNADTTDIGKLDTVSQGITLANPTGTPTPGQIIMYRITSAASQTIAHGNKFRSTDSLTLVTETTGSDKTDYLLYIWNEIDSMWDALDTNMGA